MSALDHYDYRQLQVAKDGSLVDRDQVRALRKLADDSTDVLVVSHGWNNDMAEAHQLYERIATSLDAVRAASDARGSDREVAICGVMWPSKRFADVASTCPTSSRRMKATASTTKRTASKPMRQWKDFSTNIWASRF